MWSLPKFLISVQNISYSAYEIKRDMTLNNMFVLSASLSATEFAPVFNVLHLLVTCYVGSNFTSEINENLKEIKDEGLPRTLLILLPCWLLFIFPKCFKKFHLLER
jgi:hypothetical protein